MQSYSADPTRPNSQTSHDKPGLRHTAGQWLSRNILRRLGFEPAATRLGRKMDKLNTLVWGGLYAATAEYERKIWQQEQSAAETKRLGLGESWQRLEQSGLFLSKSVERLIVSRQLTAIANAADDIAYSRRVDVLGVRSEHMQGGLVAVINCLMPGSVDELAQLTPETSEQLAQIVHDLNSTERAIVARQSYLLLFENARQSAQRLSASGINPRQVLPNVDLCLGAFDLNPNERAFVSRRMNNGLDYEAALYDESATPSDVSDASVQFI